MRIALVGFGKMGRMIHVLALEQGHQIVAVIDPFSNAPEVTATGIDMQTLNGCEVVIDFSSPEGIVGNLFTYGKLEVPVVVGTTGWYDRMEEVKGQLKETNARIIWSGNFSLGVHIFFALSRHAAKLFNLFGEYDAMIHEYHHAQKADSPSGTALMLGSILIEELERKSAIVSEKLSEKRNNDELHISSTRGGFIPGTHTISFDSPVDTIELTHRARSREGFANGAIRAAAWVMQQKSGFYAIEDMMQDVLAQV